MKKGDRVALYMPASPLLAASMLACARIGAIHRYIHCTCAYVGIQCPLSAVSITCILLSVVFAGFSAESLMNRINDGKCSGQDSNAL